MHLAYATEQLASSEMAKAIFNNTVIAESNKTVMVEGNHYFPASAIKSEYFQKNSRTSACPWKGTANYYDVVVNGKTARAAAWYYSSPKKAASEIKDHVAFWGDVRVE